MSSRPNAALALLALLQPALAAAQVLPDTTDEAVDTLEAIPVAPIRVTVLRTPLLLTRTPYAVTVESVEPGGAGLTMADALGMVPGLQVDNRYNFSQGDRISARGLGARSQFGVRGVKVLVDGIPATLPDGQTSLSHLDPWWVERAEVIRGPASSLWGNAAGGVIQLETGGPPEAGGDGAAAWHTGSHGLQRYGVEAGAAAHGLGIRARASRLLYGGFRDHGSADKRFASARFEWAGLRDVITVVAHGVAYEAENPGSLSVELMREDRTQAYAFNVIQDAGEAARQGQVGVTWRRRSDVPPGSGPGIEVSAWGLARTLDNPIPPAIIELSRRAAGLRAAVRGGIGPAADRGSWVLGVDAEGQWDDRRNFENLGGDPGALLLDQVERVLSVAPFVELSAPVGPVRAMAGLRYDRHRFRAEDRLVTASDPDDSGTRVMARVSPSLGLLEELGSAQVYVNATTSFETPTTTELVNRPGGEAGFNPELEPQRAWALEAGVRSVLGPGIRVHAAAYYTAIRDALIPFQVEGSPGRSFFRNAGSAVHRGMELDVWARLTAWLGLRAGYALVDARFDRFTVDGLDASGNRVPGVAPHRSHATLTATAGDVRAELAGRWVDAIPVDDGNTASAPSYTLLDLQGSAPPLRLGTWSARVFGGVANLLDRAYVTSVVVNAFGDRYYEPGPGRSLYVGVRLEAGP